MPEIRRLTKENLEEVAREAATILSRGGLILYPTDTLYGLGVDATNQEALEKLYALKERDREKPVHSIYPDLESVERVAEVTPIAQKLANAFLPGALTLILTQRESAQIYGGKDGSIGVRIPNNPFCLSLAHAFGKPYTATSANISGEVTHTTIDAILSQFGDTISLIDMVIDAGELPVSLPSTVVDARDGLKILREGSVPLEEIERAVSAPPPPLP